MKVVIVRNSEGKERYFVADDNGIPIESALKFIKFKDNLNYARNTNNKSSFIILVRYNQ